MRIVIFYIVFVAIILNIWYIGVNEEGIFGELTFKEKFFFFF